MAVRIRSNLGIAALHHRVAGGWRLWCVARMLDERGAGYIDYSTLYTYLVENVGVARQNFHRWLKEATQFGFFKRAIRRGADTRFLLCGESHVAVLLGTGRVDARYLVVEDVHQLFRRGWRNLLWSGYFANHLQGRIVSRKTIAEISGIERHRQRRWERDLGVQRVTNFWDSGMSGEAVSQALDENLPSFACNGKMFVRLPDMRRVSNLPTGPHGRARKNNRKIKMIMASSKGGAGAKTTKTKRLFYPNLKTAIKKSHRPASPVVWFLQQQTWNAPTQKTWQVWVPIYRLIPFISEETCPRLS